MKILITTYYLDNFCGSELFTRDLVIELYNLGYEVFVYSPILGEVSNDLKNKNKKVVITDDLRSLEKYDFDIIHAQHNITAILARSIFPKTPMVLMVHGTLPELEQLPSIDIGISKFIVISEGVRDHIITKYNVKKENIILVRNFIDTNKFKSVIPVYNIPKNLLVISNHYLDRVKKIIEKACKDLNIEVNHIGAPENVVKNVEYYINQADIIVTLGRGVLEASACERNVIVYDYQGGDGFIDQNNFYKIRKKGFSGAMYKKQYSVDEFKKEILKYNPKLGEKLRKIVIEENDTKKIVEKIEQIYDIVSKEEIPPSALKEGMLFNELNFLETTNNYLRRVIKELGG